MTLGGFDAKFSIVPLKSHSFLVALLFVSIFCLAVGFYFLWNEKGYAWVPLCVGVGLSAAGVFGWFSSRHEVDMEGAVTTEIANVNGISVKTDSRSLSSQETVNNLEKLILAMNHRIPLPHANGLVDDLGNPIPNSDGEANRVVDSINSDVRENMSLVGSLKNIKERLGGPGSGVVYGGDALPKGELLEVNYVEEGLD